MGVTTSQNAIPAVVFREPAGTVQKHKWSTDAYVDEVVAILQEAASVGLTDQYWLLKPGSGKQPVPLTNRGAARQLLQKLVENDRNPGFLLRLVLIKPRAHDMNHEVGDRSVPLVRS